MNNIRDLINRVDSQGGPDRRSMIQQLAKHGYETNYLELATNEELRQMLSTLSQHTSESSVKPSNLTGSDESDAELGVNTFINLTPNYQNYEHLVGRVLDIRPNGRVDIQIIVADLEPGKKGPLSRGSKITLNKHYLKNAQTFLPERSDIEEGPKEVLGLAQFAMGGGIPGGQSPADIIDEDLRKWFREKWVRFNPQGKIMGPCARGDDSEGKPKCLPQSKAQTLGKKGRASAAARKRREDPNPERHGSAINVATKRKSNEGVAEGRFDEPLTGWHIVYRKSGNPVHATPSFETKDQAQKYLMTRMFANHHDYKVVHTAEVGVAEGSLEEACWKGYHKEGNKKMFGKTYPNCVKNTNEEMQTESNSQVRRIQQHLNKEFNANLDVDGILGPLTKKSIEKFLPASKKKLAPEPEKTTAVQGAKTKMKENKNCPECGGPLVEFTQLNEKQDACYYKVKSRYKVWPSAYASGALVQCRKRGAKNWGNKSKVKENTPVNMPKVGPVVRDVGNTAAKGEFAPAGGSMKNFDLIALEDVAKAAPTTTAYILRGADAQPARIQQIAQAYGYDPVEIQGNEIKWKPSTGAPVTVGNIQGNQATLNYRMTDQGSQLPNILKKLGTTTPTAPANESTDPIGPETYVLYIRNQAVAEYETMREAQREMAHLMAQFPSQQRNFTIKKKVCQAVDIKNQPVLENTIKSNSCPKCQGPVYSNRYLAEKMNTCYHKKSKGLFSSATVTESLQCRNKR